MTNLWKRTSLRAAWAGIAAVVLFTSLACSDAEPKPKPWGTEQPAFLPGSRVQRWAVAPAVNLSGVPQADPVLQADLVYSQLQQVQGLTVIPVDRVIEVYQALHLVRIQSEKQAALVCDLLGCDGLVIPTITAYDPYNPPKLGASLQLFVKPPGYQRPAGVDPRDLARQGSPQTPTLPGTQNNFAQAVGFFDADNGTVREALARYAAGRNDPQGAYSQREYLVNMDRYCGFVYAQLIERLIHSPKVLALG